MDYPEEFSTSHNLRCESCGRPLDLRCEDCGCPVSCHEFIYPTDGERLPYCVWDLAPCSKEQRPLFFAAIQEWMREMREVKHRLPG